MLKLCGFRISNYHNKVRIALLEKGIEFEEDPTCTPDMMPVIGPGPRHRGLWFAFGHAHHGLTLGPVTGRLIAEMVCGEKPFIDPTAYRADRF